MARILEESILEVHRAADIVDVVQSYFPLKRAGANYRALCPFHEEKTPSFNVHPEKQIFKCFGCQKGGSVITFVMLKENVDFVDAVKILAERTGVTLRWSGGGEAGPGKEDVYRVLEWAAGLYRTQLLKMDEAAPAREYLTQRGVLAETAERFQLGYALSSWNGLIERARRAEISEKLLVAAGLILERDSGGYYDRFRGRLMFPITDARGKVIAFGARALKDEEPKYINSPETSVFSKGCTFYGLNMAREVPEDTKTLYIVEGYFDVILPVQAGMRGVVATLGTALTRDHLRLLRRYAEKVVLVFDGDAAGQKAGERGLDLLLSENVDLFVAVLPTGLDPADCVVKEGTSALARCLENPLELFEFLVRSLESKTNVSTPAGRARVVEEILDRIGQIPDEIKREILLQQVASRYRLDERLLRQRMTRSTAKNTEEPIHPSLSREEAVGRELIEIMLHRNETIPRVKSYLGIERFPTEGTRRLASRVYDLHERKGEVRPEQLLAALEDAEAMAAVADSLHHGVRNDQFERRLEGCLERLDAWDRERKIAELRERQRRAGTEEERNTLLSQLLELKRDHGKVKP